MQLHGDNHVCYPLIVLSNQTQILRRKNKKAHSVRVGQSLVSNFAYNSGPRTSLGGVLKRYHYGKNALIKSVMAQVVGRQCISSGADRQLYFFERNREFRRRGS
jgi:hypothetical protein